jgi:hypothetical protein
VKDGDQELATRPMTRILKLASVCRARRSSGSTGSVSMLFRDAEGRAESTVRACDAYHAAKGATANRERSVTFDEERWRS